MAIILPANTLAASGFSVDNSCRFNGDAYLHKTVGTPTNADKYTLSVWIKRSILTSFGPDNAQYIMSYDGGGNPREHIRFNDSTDTLNWYFRDSGGTATNLTTTQEFRDVSAWYHFVFVYDSGQAVAANRQTIYCNGAEITSFSSSGYVAQDTDSNLNSNVSVKIGAIGTGSPSVYSSQYLSEVVFLDGQTLAASNFGEYDEDSPTIWKPKDVSTLTFGDNGFYLDFEDSANLGNDANGGTDWTEVGLAATDQATDTPTNNFCTMSPIASLDSPVMSEGNCYMTNDGGSEHAVSTFAASSGRWYFEVKVTVQNSANALVAGISDVYMSQKELAEGWLGMDTGQYGYVGYDGKIYHADDGGTAYGDVITTNDILGVYVDLEDNKLYFAKNGTVQNSGTGHTITAAASTTGGAYQFVTGDWFTTTSNVDYGVNFGGCPAFAISSGNTDDNGYGNFEYSPNITGDGSAKSFYALNSANLAEFG